MTAAELYPALGRRVSTYLGVGWLWQAFEGRIGVVLDDLPARVVFLEEADPDVHPLPDDGRRPPWRMPTRGRGRPSSFQPPTFFGLGEP